MALGLNVNRVVNVTLTIAPIAAGYRNFGAVMAIGPSDVIDTLERVRQYTDVEGVVADFGTNAPETKAAQLHFSQVPQPNLFYVGRWAQTASAGILRGGFLTGLQLALSNFTGITTGGLTISINGTELAVTGLNFSAATNLNGVASILQAGIRAAGAAGSGVVVTWDGSRFTISSGTTGPASSVSYGTPPATGTDITTVFALRSGRASVPVNGIAAESLVNAIAELADVSSEWYAAAVAVPDPATVSVIDHLAAAQLIESMSMRRVYGATIADRAVLDGTRSDDLASQAQLLGLERTFTQFSSWSPYAVFSLMGRFASVDFQANNSTITLKFKQEPGVVAERLTETQADALASKNCNVFVFYNNGKAILQEGVMANGFFIDEVQGTDWMVNEVQVDLFNLFFQSNSKVPQTDPGMNQIVNCINSSFLKGVYNGLLGPGQWNADGFGALVRGALLKTGFYTWCPPVATQAQAEREKRVTPSIQAAAKLQGAVHKTNLAINVNR